MSAHILASAFVELLTPSVVLYLAIGVLLGTMIGALPGLSATMGVALITPITFWLDKVDGFAMLMGLWNAAIFAGGITAILINTPGTPASITQAWDGYPLYKEGKGWFGTWNQRSVLFYRWYDLHYFTDFVSRSDRKGNN